MFSEFFEAVAAHRGRVAPQPGVVADMAKFRTAIAPQQGETSWGSRPAPYQVVGGLTY